MYKEGRNSFILYGMSNNVTRLNSDEIDNGCWRTDFSKGIKSKNRIQKVCNTSNECILRCIIHHGIKTASVNSS